MFSSRWVGLAPPRQAHDLAGFRWSVDMSHRNTYTPCRLPRSGQFTIEYVDGCREARRRKSWRSIRVTTAGGGKEPATIEFDFAARRSRVSGCRRPIVTIARGRPKDPALQTVEGPGYF